MAAHLVICLQDIVATLEEQMCPLVQAELSVLVDVLHRPELLFPPGTEARKKCETGGFISRSVLTFVFSVSMLLLLLTGNLKGMPTAEHKIAMLTPVMATFRR